MSLWGKGKKPVNLVSGEGVGEYIGLPQEVPHCDCEVITSSCEEKAAKEV